MHAAPFNTIVYVVIDVVKSMLSSNIMEDKEDH